MGDIFRLDDKVAVVIGRTGGIGETVAAGLAERGAKIAIASRSIQRLEEVARKIQSKSEQEVMAFQVDVVDERSVAQLV